MISGFIVIIIVNRSCGLFSIFRPEIVIHWKILMYTTIFSQQRSESNVRFT